MGPGSPNRSASCAKSTSGRARSRSTPTFLSRCLPHPYLVTKSRLRNTREGTAATNRSFKGSSAIGPTLRLPRLMIIAMHHGYTEGLTMFYHVSPRLRSATGEGKDRARR